MFLHEETDKDEATRAAFQKDFGIEQDLFFPAQRDRIISDCMKLVESQAQELFCDLFGAVLFGKSYVYAFDFFLNPGFGTREFDYPSLMDRIRFIKEVAPVEEPYILTLDGPEKPLASTRTPPLVALADKITARLQPGLLQKARDVAAQIQYDSEEADSTDKIAKNLRLGIPPRMPKSPIDILNAVWAVFLEKQAQAPTLGEISELTSLMNNLCLKSFEIYEYNKRT